MQGYKIVSKNRKGLVLQKMLQSNELRAYCYRCRKYQFIFLTQGSYRCVKCLAEVKRKNFSKDEIKSALELFKPVVKS
jgi:hypothetical protein